MTGCNLPSLEGTPLKLRLAALGQQASPFQSLWVGVQLRSHLESFFGTQDRCSPAAVLQDFIHDMVDLAKSVFASRQQQIPAVITPSDEITLEEDPEVLLASVESCLETPIGSAVSPCIGSGNDGLDPSCLDCDIPCAVDLPVVASSLPHLGDADSFTLYTVGCSGCVIPLSSRSLTIADFLVANSKLGVVEGSCRDGLDGIDLAQDDLLVGRSIVLDFPSVSPVVTQLDVPMDEDILVTAPFQVLPSQPLDPLAELSGCQLLGLNFAGISGVVHLHMVTSKVMNVDCRLQILNRQERLMADDEIRFHVYQFMSAPQCTDWVFLDPLLALELLMRPCPELFCNWLTSLPRAYTAVVTIVKIQQHWVPFTFRWTDGTLLITTWLSVSRLPASFVGLSNSILVGLGLQKVDISWQLLPCH